MFIFLIYLQSVQDVCQMHVVMTGRWYWSYQGINMDLGYALAGLLDAQFIFVLTYHSKSLSVRKWYD